MLGSVMIERLRTLFGLPETPAPKTTHVAELPRAAAALLALTARLDGSFDEPERQAIERAMRERFGLAPADAEAVLSEADKVASQATDLFSLTNEINQHLDLDRRVTIIEMLWEVAYADGVVDDFEANLVRRASGLLHVSDRDSGAAKQRVLARLGVEPTKES